MGIDILRGQPQDYAEIIDFANYVFHERSGFPKLLPKLYENHPETAAQHYLIKENGRIVAMVGAFPQDFQCAGRTLKAFGIGTVSVNPYKRGKGYMKALMAAALADFKAAGADFTYLGGQRQRYEYHGYVPTGVKALVTVTQRNLEALPQAQGSYTFKPLGAAGDEALNAVLALHNARPFHALRPAHRFAEMCLSFGGFPYAIFRDGVPVGYLIYAAHDRHVTECYLADYTWTAQAVKAFHAAQGLGAEGVNVLVFPDQLGALRGFATVCDGLRWVQSKSFCFLNFPRMLDATLALTQALRPRPDCDLTLAIEGEPSALTLSVRGGETAVTPTGAAPDMVLTRLEAMTQLYSPLGMGEGHPLLPLPLYMLRGDDV